jgi:metal-dependent HD superfamily phosphatase/phosphodiesterase
MTNSAGIFQIDELLKEKLHKSPIRQYLAIRAVIKGTTEKKLLNEFVLQ